MMVVIDGYVEYAQNTQGIKHVLDWTQATLFGFQHAVNKQKIDSIIAALISNEELPLVRVCSFDQKIFYLPFLYGDPTCGFNIDGGHHRSFAYYSLQKPMPCLLVEPKYLLGGAVKCTSASSLPSYDIKDLLLV